MSNASDDINNIGCLYYAILCLVFISWYMV